MVRKLVTVASVWLLVTTTVLVATTSVAGACSCEGVSAESLQWAHGGLYGTVTAVDAFTFDAGFGETQNQLIFAFDVEIDLLDNIPDQILVESIEDDGGNCGVSLAVGDQLGMLVFEDDEGVVHGDGCGVFGLAFAESFVPFDDGRAAVGAGLSVDQRRLAPPATPEGPGSVPEEAPPAIEAPPPTVAPIPVEPFPAPPLVPPPPPPIALPAFPAEQDTGSDSNALLWIGIGVLAVLALMGAVMVAAKE